ncbi:MAG: ATP-dependent DNA helicase RecG [Bacteroidales bacterium]|nr:ATP-dependent DNA helicase RecG [Bacteroidales bacterium]
MNSNVQQILDTPIEFLKGVGPMRAEVLKKELSIFRFEDLLNNFPFRYYDKKEIRSISEVHSAMPNVLLRGRIVAVDMQGVGRAQRLTAVLQDDTGKIELVWFQGIKWVKEKVLKGFEYVVFGKPTIFSGRFNIAHPEIETVAQFEANLAEGIMPVYNSSEALKRKGLDSRGISKLTEILLKTVVQKIPENLPDNLIKKYRLLSHEQAFRNIHFPQNETLLHEAQKRLKFEELLFMQLQILRSKIYRAKKLKGIVFQTVGDNFNNFYNHYLPFELTNAQKRVVKEIRRDTCTGAQMNRLLQGDVGSGKTLVALLSMLIAIDNGYQTCMMAPTEILAQQHFNTISKFLGEMSLQVRLLTGSTKTAERKKIFSDLENGNIHILIGTHALIENAVQFKNLGLAVIDEQHRFGVQQRAQLWTKNHDIVPHVLVMTATPIPRTLAMTVYGDLDVSIIDELPPGRKPVKTVHYYDSKRLLVFAFMRDQIRQGRQIYVVYPLIEESETLDLKDLMDGYNSISRDFPLPDYQIGIVHGKMKPEIKDYEMQRFKEGKTHILVATTVIEVGVDVPNASVMVIESAERFGLSQLHQLRGRVGRGADQSFCILMSSFKLSQDARLRLETMVQTTDGFKIAEADLKLRGPGDIVGTRQSGIMDLKIASIVQDEAMVKTARIEAMEILSTDPNLSLPENATLQLQLRKMDSVSGNWGMIS